MRHSTLFISLILGVHLVASACTGPPSQSQRQASVADLSATPPTHTPIPQPTPLAADTNTPESTSEATTDSQQQADQAAPNTPVVTADESNVNIRSGPGTDYDIIGTLPAGQSLEIVGRTADSSWWQVALPGGLGWVAASVTTPRNVDERIPIAEAPAPPTSPIVAPPVVSGLQEGQVINVIDGDTIDVLVDGAEYRVRYILVDTPETKHSEKPVEPFGPEAYEANRQLVEGKMVLLEKDISERDQYGRLLRYVYVGDLLINEELLRRGLAQVATFPPDVKYVDRFLEVQRQAQAAGVGMWGSEPVVEQPPPAVAPAEPPPSGNAGYSGPYDPFGPDRDCGDFATHTEAQAFYTAAGGPATDRHRLDRDRDGIACESLP